MPRSGPGPGARPPGPLVGLMVGAFLGASLFLASAFIYERWFRGRVSAEPPAGFSPGADARATVRILATLPGPGIQAALIPLREDGVGGEAAAAVLDGALFPGEEPRRWARLLISNPGGGSVRLPLDGGGLTLSGPWGTAGNEDLAGAFAARSRDLSPHRRFDLVASRVQVREVELPAGARTRVLVAFPSRADPDQASELLLPGGAKLRPREASVESLRRALLDGRVEGIPEASPAEARAAPGDAR